MVTMTGNIHNSASAPTWIKTKGMIPRYICSVVTLAGATPSREKRVNPQGRVRHDVCRVPAIRSVTHHE